MKISLIYIPAAHCSIIYRRETRE